MRDSKKLKIKRCPFCGNKAHVAAFAGNLSDAYMVVCNEDSCRCGFPCTDMRFGSFTEELAIELWNRRK